MSTVALVALSLSPGEAIAPPCYAGLRAIAVGELRKRFDQTDHDYQTKSQESITEFYSLNRGWSAYSTVWLTENKRTKILSDYSLLELINHFKYSKGYGPIPCQCH